jgi:hypothetical protein
MKVVQRVEGSLIFYILKECTTFKTSVINNPATQRNNTEDLNPHGTGDYMHFMGGMFFLCQKPLQTHMKIYK